MNRNSTRSGRNGGRSMTRRNLQQSNEEEPMMFEYLQNIDRELEELKKKRQFIEQHHGYFQNQREPSHSRPDNEREFLYNAPRFYEQSYDSPNASHSTYANSQVFETQNNDYISFNSGRKRPNPWQSDSMLKRFAGYEGDDVEKSFGSRLGPKPTSRYFDDPMKFKQSYKQHKKGAPPKKNAAYSQKPTALMSLNTRGSFSSNHTEFKPKDKVSKPKYASTRPNNLNAYPLATRKALIEETIKASPRRPPPIKKPSQTVKNVDEPLIFDGDSQHSRKVRGRLELAVGHILKDVKERMHMKFQEDLYNPPSNMLRLLKQIIRERIRTLMLGKRIDLFMDIVNAYRKRYPLDTDENMMNAAQETLKLNTEFKEADTAEEFLRLNLSRVLIKKLNEMFLKLEEVYSKTEEDPSKSTAVTKKDDEDDVIIVEAATAIENNSGIPDTCKKLTFTLEELDNLLEQKLPVLLKRFVPQLTKIMTMDYSYESSVGEVVIKTMRGKGQKFEQLGRTQDNRDAGNNQEQKNVNNEEEQTDKKKTNADLHFVRIVGSPSLPTRDVMQKFLEEFNPKSIKKHKRRHNLLFVGFAEKKNFDDIIDKNGTTLGKYTIEIKPKDPTGNKAEGNTTNDNVDSNDNVATNETSQLLDTSLDSELNCQIDDLLSSIRQGEENNGSEKTTERTTAEILNTGDFDFEAKEQNKVTIIFESDDDKNEDKPINEKKNANVEKQSEKVDEKTGCKLSEFTDGTLEIIEDITEEAEKNAEKLEKVAEQTENLEVISEEAEEIMEKPTEIIEIEDKSKVNFKTEDPVAVENTAEINTGGNNDVVQAETPVKEQAITEVTVKEEKNDDNLKETVRGTPTRASSRLASVKPSTIITRRSSKLAQNNE